MPKITPWLWFDTEAEEASNFYTSVFPNSQIVETAHYGSAGPRPDEVDYYWNKLSDGGEQGPCGWLKDRFGLSWQIVPTRLGELLGDPDREKSQRLMAAMMQVGKIEIDELERAAAA
jgi:predicted 3-demethylubiquinone-9 3-methyltransferase (glyoxalase superfamily)